MREEKQRGIGSDRTFLRKGRESVEQAIKQGAERYTDGIQDLF